MPVLSSLPLFRNSLSLNASPSLKCPFARSYSHLQRGVYSSRRCFARSVHFELAFLCIFSLAFIFGMRLTFCGWTFSVLGIAQLCSIALNVNRSAYYKWRKRTPSGRQIENEQIVEWIKTLYEQQDGILGYRQMTITVNREYNVHYNRKRIRRLMQILRLKSVCRKKRYNYTKLTP